MNVPTHARSLRFDVSEWAGRRVLVTGATTGFIGSGVTRRLSERGARVAGVARRPPSEKSSVRIELCDLSDLDHCRSLTADATPEFIIDPLGIRSPLAISRE
jgi:nucleoside-diphosphate-sugar epimerase